MATYNNQYAMNIKPATPNLRGISDTYDNTGTNKVSDMGLGELYELDYDRDKIEQVFNQGTDAQYALMQKENQIAENQYANQTFANQQAAIEALRQQRNSQIASGMARGLSAAEEQGTILGLQQESQAGALELANARQLEADKIAAEYANNVVKALQEANSVKQAMAQVGAKLYEADMLGYTGELSAMAQMDANAVNKYGYDLGYEGTVYSANKNLEGTKYTANKNYDGTVYAANKNYDATIGAANIQAAATRAAAAANGTTQNEMKTAVEYALDYASRNNPNPGDPNSIVDVAYEFMKGNGFKDENGSLWDSIDSIAVAGYGKDQTKKDWEKNKANKANKAKETENTNTASVPPSGTGAWGGSTAARVYYTADGVPYYK